MHTRRIDYPLKRQRVQNGADADDDVLRQTHDGPLAASGGAFDRRALTKDGGAADPYEFSDAASCGDVSYVGTSGRRTSGSFKAAVGNAQVKEEPSDSLLPVKSRDVHSHPLPTHMHIQNSYHLHDCVQFCVDITYCGTCLSSTRLSQFIIS